MKASSYLVEVVLDDHSEAESILVLDGKATVPIFEFHRIDPESGRRACAATVRTAACRFREFVTNRPLSLPRHPLKRFAIEHFQALA